MSSYIQAIQEYYEVERHEAIATLDHALKTYMEETSLELDSFIDSLFI